jgi:hypothetical protein
MDLFHISCKIIIFISLTQYSNNVRKMAELVNYLGFIDVIVEPRIPDESGQASTG